MPNLILGQACSKFRFDVNLFVVFLAIENTFDFNQYQSRFIFNLVPVWPSIMHGEFPTLVQQMQDSPSFTILDNRKSLNQILFGIDLKLMYF